MKTPFPETQYSLIARLTDTQDVAAWDQFVSIYEPLVYRLARTKGMQDADAREIVQEVLVAVSGAVERWEPDPERGRFRDWLFRIARNLMIKFLTRRKYRPLGSGDSGIATLLDQTVDPSPDATALFDLEYQREVYRWAAERVQEQVRDSTWQAFSMTTIDGRAIADVAHELNMSIGAIYIACSRVRSRLRDLIAQHEQQTIRHET